jgi:hypothetical protein
MSHRHKKVKDIRRSTHYKGIKMSSKMNELNNYQEIKQRLKCLFELYGISEPKVIREALPTDPCDVTDPPNEVRIHRSFCDEDYQARHVFGHYLADLHAVNDEQSDIVADVIARMIDADNNMTKERR